MKRPFLFLIVALVAGNAAAQLSLDSCRALALKSNRQLSMARLQQDIADNMSRVARAKYLPHISAVGTYQHTSEELELLSGSQKAALSGLGTSIAPALQSILPAIGPDLGAALGQMNPVAALNGGGQQIVDAFHTDTRNVYAGAILFTQPVFMGGAIIAMNRAAKLNQQLSAHNAEAKRQAVVYATDQAYWQVVSLCHKQRLARSYRELMQTLSNDVHKMIEEGVATRSDGLNIDVKLSEAEMTLQQADDGVTLSRMCLCQLMGLPLDSAIELADEQCDTLPDAPAFDMPDVSLAQTQRPELCALENGVQIAQQSTKILRAANLPQVVLTGGYAVSNPNVLDGFQKKFGGFWNVGVMIRVPIWNWGDNMYKVRAAKGAATIARLELEETREKVALQAEQSAFKLGEAHKRLALARTNVSRAEENRHTAHVGFREGVITTTVLLEAMTAWLQAQSQEIDAQIGVRLSQSDLQKAVGVLQ